MNSKKKVAFYTLGCKLNFSETSTIARNFQSEGFERVKFEEKADIYVINTCSVTDNADKRFKSVVKSALKKNHQALLFILCLYFTSDLSSFLRSSPPIKNFGSTLLVSKDPDN